MNMSEKASTRKGIVLLLVLAILAAFGLIVLAYVVLTGHTRRGAEAAKRFQEQYDPPQQVVEQVLMQVLRGSNDPHSSIWCHSLLEDMYGERWQEGFLMELYYPNPADKATFWAIPATYWLDRNANSIPDVDPDPNKTEILPIENPEHWVGCVLTFTSSIPPGLCAISTRVVDYVPVDGDPGYFRVAISPSLPRPSTPDNRYRMVRYVLNGAPFSGTGVGYAGQQAIDLMMPEFQKQPIWPIALFPNAATFDFRRTFGQPLTGDYLGPDRNPGTNDDWVGPDNTPGTADDWPGRDGIVGPDPGNGICDDSFGSDGIQGTPDDGNVFFWPLNANEDYDAPDYQNMFLAMGVPDTAMGNLVVPEPSYHRVALAAYWFNQAMRNAPDPATRFQMFQQLLEPEIITDKDLKRQIALWKRRFVLRPLKVFHPYFDGSNPGYYDGVGMVDSNGDGVPDRLTSWEELPFDPSNPELSYPHRSAGQGSPWDVDNDGDGVADSVWVDVGLPVRQLRDGLRYKPLAAILCVDLDGRLNVNAHGSSFAPVTTPAPAVIAQASWAGRFGFGPAEINNPLVSTVSARRYGADLVPGAPGLDPLADWQLKFYPGAYGSPLDLFGATLFSLDVLGQPLYSPPLSGDANSPWRKSDNPYELDLLTPAAFSAAGNPKCIDSPFTAAELEAVLRPYDKDSRDLPQRLKLAISQSDRLNVSTHSYAVPSIPGTLPPRLLARFLEQAEGDRLTVIQNIQSDPANAKLWRDFLTFLDRGALNGSDWLSFLAVHIYLEYKRLHAEAIDIDGVNQINLMLQQARLELPRYRLLPWEILRKLPFDLNRPFGDGLDNNGNDLVDEVLEFLTPADTSRPDNLVDVNLDGTNSPADAALARQLYARHLYMLAMMLLDTHEEDEQTDSTKRKVFAQRVAQWAVNCVDFRDPDSAMTPFEYDWNPWDGWLPNADGELLIQQAAPPGRPADFDASGTILQDQYGVVWGCEAPELLISEVHAFHDRRVADTDFDNGPGTTTAPGPNQDPTLDQTRIPQGSLFVELYCPRNVLLGRTDVSSAVKYPADLFSYANGVPVLDLARLTPNGYPVWRLVVTEKCSDDADNNFKERYIQESGGAGPEEEGEEQEQPTAPEPWSQINSYMVQQYQTPPTDWPVRSPWDSASLLWNDQAAATIERLIWFVQPPAGVADRNRIYYLRQGTPLLEPGQYGVVGPRPETFLGSWKYESAPTQPQYGAPASQRITLLTGGHEVFTRALEEDTTIKFRYPEVGTEIRTPRGLIVAADPPATWTDVSHTAPLGIGISVSEPIPALENYYAEPTDDNPATGARDAYGDLQRQDSSKLFPDTPLDDSNDHISEQTGTTENYKTLVLQRVADPLQNYDPVTNPYLTVDWSPVALTVFNGEDEIQYLDLDLGKVTSLDLDLKFFKSRQRGWGDSELWPLSSLIDAPDSAFQGDAEKLCFPFNFEDTFGFINEPFWAAPLDEKAPIWADAAPRNFPWNTALQINDATLASYLGSPLPAKAFSALTWNNRPFAGPLEVLLVPHSAPTRLLLECSKRSDNPYEVSDPVSDPNKRLPPILEAPFGSVYGHLIDFFAVSAAGKVGEQQVVEQVVDVGAILDYLRVPSPFVRSQLPVATPTGGPGGFVPPFDRLDQYREPGQVNLNTIHSDSVWTNVTLHDTTEDGGLKTYRGQDLGQNYPTAMANPFRTFNGASFIPPVEGLTSLLWPPVGGESRPLGVISSVLRPVKPATPTAPLFDISGDARNPVMRYRELTRLGNLVTTRSNVYAIWITVGYFEVQPVMDVAEPDPDAPGNFLINGMSLTPQDIADIYPDGYMLGQELGSDTGEIQRHRGFFIYDRSIPVGFKRGYDLNVDQGLLIRRIID